MSLVSRVDSRVMNPSGRCLSVAAGLLYLAGSGVCYAQARKPTPKQPAPPPVYLPDAAALSAPSAILIDEASGQVLFEKRADQVMYPASTTKMLTALLLIERCRPDEMVTAPDDIEKVGESTLHLKAAEKLKMSDLLAGILLRSGNDASTTGAVHASGSVEAFSKLMNERAQQMGCKSTNFCNPHGLHDPEHFTTARDLALIAREGMRYPEFRELVRNRKAVIERQPGQTDTLIVSRNKYLVDDPTADGIKTGFTRPAGMCFVGSASRSGYRLISVVLKSDDWRKDTRELLDWGFKTFVPHRPVVAGKALDQPIALPTGETVFAVPVRSFRQMVRLGESRPVQLTLVPIVDLKRPIAAGQQVGFVQVVDGSRTEKIPVVAREGVARPDPRESRMPLAIGAVAFLAFWAGFRVQRGRFWKRVLREERIG